MLDLELIEPRLVDLLIPLRMAGAVVRTLPDTPQQQGAADNAAAVAVVAIMGATAVDRGSMDGKVQAVSYEIAVELRSSSLRGELGLYRLPQTVRRLWAGQRVPGLGLLGFAGWELTERTTSYWGGVVRFKATVMDAA